jgi:hypothetical protein
MKTTRTRKLEDQIKIMKGLIKKGFDVNHNTKMIQRAKEMISEGLCTN